MAAPRNTNGRVRLLLMVALAAAAATNVVLATSKAPSRPAVVYVGDSLMQNTTRELTYATSAMGADAVVKAFPGAALCSMFDEIAEQAKSKPEVLVIETAGNANVFNPCVSTDGTIPRGQQYLDLYSSDLAKAVTIVKETSPATKLVVVGPPPLLPDTKARFLNVKPEGAGTLWASKRLNFIFAANAAKLGYIYVDGGSHLSGPDGNWTETMPCVPGERCLSDGTNVVRSPDGLHFCPTQLYGTWENCPVYSSGAHRFAESIMAAVGPLVAGT